MTSSYDPSKSGNVVVTAPSGGWTTKTSTDFVDQLTGTAVSAGTRFGTLTFTNTSSVQAVVTWGNTSTIVNATTIAQARQLPAGDTVMLQAFPLGGTLGVEYIGVQPDTDTLSSTNLGTGVNSTTVEVFAEFMAT